MLLIELYPRDHPKKYSPFLADPLELQPEIDREIADIKTKVKMHLRNIQILFWTAR